MIVSLCLHAVVFVVNLRLRPPALPHVAVTINHSVEMGIEEARPGPVEAPAQPLAPQIEEAPPPRPRRQRPLRDPLPSLPEPRATLTPPSMLLAPERDAEAPDSALAAADVAEGDVLDESALAQADVAVESDAGTTGIPGLARAAGSLAPGVPQGSVVTLLLRMDRVRENPNAQRVSELLRSIRDWRAVLDGTEIDPVRDFNTVLLASADPFGTPDHPPDVHILVRTRAGRGFLRASVEQMAGARASSPLPVELPDGGVSTEGSLRAHFDDPDAGPLARPARAVWRRQGGAEVATVDRYMGPHSVVLLGDDLAAITTPARVPQLLAVLGARSGSAREHDDGGRLVAMFQAEGLRNLMSLPGRATLIPRRVDVALNETRVGGSADGGVELLAVLPYDDEAQATRAAPLMAAFMDDMLDGINQFAGTLQGRLAAGAGAVHFDALRGALRAVRVRADGASVRVEATLAPAEVAELLNAQRLAQVYGQ